MRCTCSSDTGLIKWNVVIESSSHRVTQGEWCTAHGRRQAWIDVALSECCSAVCCELQAVAVCPYLSTEPGVVCRDDRWVESLRI